MAGLVKNASNLRHDRRGVKTGVKNDLLLPSFGDCDIVIAGVVAFSPVLGAVVSEPTVVLANGHRKRVWFLDVRADATPSIRMFDFRDRTG